MSDFIYSGAGTPHTDLKHELDQIYGTESPPVLEFQGGWGSLAVTKNQYFGFDALETETHVAVVLGGPVLLFRDNRFLTGTDPAAAPSSTAGTQALLDRWERGLLNWQNNLSGPFAALFIDKRSGEISMITDLLSFIPLYHSKVQDTHYISSHVDALARITHRETDLDLCSQVDFTLHGTITFPYTSYRDVWQLAPGSIHKLSSRRGSLQSVNYWLPREVEHYQNMEEPIVEFRKNLESYLKTLTLGMDKVSLFLTSGEDSRTIAAVLPKEKQRDAHIYLDTMNREGQLARKAAKKYGLNFRMIARSADHYLEVMPQIADLVGSGTEFLSVHSYGFHKEADLQKYPAVFGGFFADALFKGSSIKKTSKSTKYQFVKERKDLNWSPAGPIQNELFDPEVLEGVRRRRAEHLERVKRFRSKSASEWFELWPASMNKNISNYTGNRRLFRSYEPFMSHAMVQLSSVLPQEWKLNRRFYQKAIKPYMRSAKWLPQGEGYLPYFSHTPNKYFTFKSFLARKLQAQLTKKQRNERPWTDWRALSGSKLMTNRVAEYAEGFKNLSPAFREKSVDTIFSTDGLGKFGKFDLLQVLYHSSARRKRSPELVYVRKLG